MDELEGEEQEMKRCWRKLGRNEGRRERRGGERQG